MTGVIRIEDYMARSYLDDLKEKYEPVKKERETDYRKWFEGWALLPAIPLSALLLSDQAKANSSFYSGPFYEESMIPVAAMQTGVSDVVKQKIISAFDPLVELMIALSLPISGVMLTGGALMILVGMKDMGFKLIMNAGLGYVLVQMSPLFIDLLAGVGAAI